MSKKQIEFNITPEEMIKLSEHNDLAHTIAANRLVVAYHAAGHSCQRDFIFGYAACFRAGIIEGKRQERAKRRRSRE